MAYNGANKRLRRENGRNRLNIIPKGLKPCSRCEFRHGNKLTAKNTTMKANNIFKKYDERGNVVAVGYWVKSDYVKKGEYKPTELDRQKKGADILLESIDGNYYTLRLQKPLEVKGRGVRRYSGNVIAVTESVYNKLKDKYNIMCNF